MTRFRLLAITTSFLLGDSSVRDAFEARLADLDLRRDDTLELEYVPESALPDLSRAIDRLRPDALFVGGSTQTVTALESAGTLPIISWGLADAILGRTLPSVCGYGPRPDHDRRCLGILRQLVPGLDPVGLLYDEGYAPGVLHLGHARDAATTLGIRCVVYPARTGPELDRAFAAMAVDGMRAVRMLNSRFLGRLGAGVAERALTARLPLMAYEQTTKAGGLVSYTPDFVGLAPLFADLVAAIAAGRRPEELGVRPCPAMTLALNRSTARRLLIEIPGTLLGPATRLYD